MTTNSKPVDKFNIGSIHASVWKNEGKDGAPFYKTTFENRYRQGEEWKTTTSYSQHDLVNLAKVALQAHSAVLKLSRNEQAAESSDPDDAAA